MRRSVFTAVMLLTAAGCSVAQITAPSTDVLGAHLNYGRGCTACHSPHSGAMGNGKSEGSAPDSGTMALWGEDASGLYGKTIITGGGKFVEVLPASLSAGTPDVEGILMCLTCHDGNYAHRAMMKNSLYEQLPATYGTSNSIPTLIGGGRLGRSTYLSEHPVGLSATVRCGGDSDWDCTEINGELHMNGANSSRFVNNYGYFVKPASYGNTAVVMCTTCHEPHMMNVVKVGKNSMSGLPAGNYATMFFLRAPYNPNDTNPMSNQTAQFCRQCHADKSNEVNGSTARTIF